ncbi:hypothetical protein [Actinomadura sp. NEAU-AAG7]|uniref:hypothetical protein n=1 Tax=Actinomadura sp. NEAU-AAG7 TaxID=2839640 RepID=UPI001BE4A0EA|nr:hypothetical protein [Actinomadura sp. NEAU-AAG7]MBT2212371.1 hypothetical protein [Actinomadura sp. NEAU-AAG7]
MDRPDFLEFDYLREIERLAGAVVAAADTGVGDGGEANGTLRSGIDALARVLRYYHFPLDGCLDEEADRRRVRLAGAAIIRPDAMPIGMSCTYQAACKRLGVEARPEGWALWNTWGEGELRVTMVVAAVEATEGLFMNWAKGRDLLPVMPLPSQVAQVIAGWIEPPTFSPYGRRRLGLDGDAL